MLSNFGIEITGGIYNVRIRDIFFDGRDTGGYGAGSLRIKSQRGRGVRFLPIILPSLCATPRLASPDTAAPSLSTSTTGGRARL